MSNNTFPPYSSSSFMEQQFPVAKVSIESYKERKSGGGQTLTGLGKWWGRKPLILVRAALLGLLMPASDNPQKDREIFLKILTMDRDGLFLRKSKSISQARLIQELNELSSLQKQRFLDTEDSNKLAKLSRQEKLELQRLVFARMNYDEKLEYCDRPERVENLPEETWAEINAYLVL